MFRLDRRLEPEGTVRRFEVIDGAVGRRRWSADDRARILEETFVPGVVVSVVAHHHGLTPQQLFTWRREARQVAALPAFVPAVTAPEPMAVDPARADPPRRRIRRSSSRRRAVGIEVEAGGITVRIGDGASPAIIAAVIGALKGGA